MGRLDGQIAIVTGAGTGIGRSTALMLAAEGAHVVVTGRRRAPLDAVVAEIEKAGGKAAAREADVAKPAQGRALAEWVIKEQGRVDILINNAGHSSKARNARWVPLDEWEAVINVNLTGVFALTQAVLPSMIEHGGGTIVTVGSMAALKPGLIGGAPYGAAKAGVLNFMGHLHTVLRDKGIRATSPRHHDAARGRGAGHSPLRHVARAHGGGGDGPEPDAHARPEPGHRGLPQSGSASGSEVVSVTRDSRGARDRDSLARS